MTRKSASEAFEPIDVVLASIKSVVLVISIASTHILQHFTSGRVFHRESASTEVRIEEVGEGGKSRFLMHTANSLEGIWWNKKNGSIDGEAS